jgi:hypothetical protein
MHVSRRRPRCRLRRSQEERGKFMPVFCEPQSPHTHEPCQQIRFLRKPPSISKFPLLRSIKVLEIVLRSVPKLSRFPECFYPDDTIQNQDNLTHAHPPPSRPTSSFRQSNASEGPWSLPPRGRKAGEELSSCPAGWGIVMAYASLKWGTNTILDKR